MWPITGEDKVEALLRLQAGDGAIPAGRISTVDALVITDRAATASRSR